MKERTGKECKKKNCNNYQYYSNWFANMGQGYLTRCRECKWSYVSQFEAQLEKDKKALEG